MKKNDVEGKNPNQNSTIGENIGNYNDILRSMTSTSTSIKKYKLHLPRSCFNFPKVEK